MPPKLVRFASALGPVLALLLVASAQALASACDRVARAGMPVEQGTPPGQTYYLDCTSGDDNTDGLDADRPWSSLGRANQARLSPGDALLLRRDCFWTGTLQATWNGTPSQPITIGAYGSGALPRIGGSAVVLIDVTGSYLTIDSIALSATPDRVEAACKKVAVGDRTGLIFEPNANYNRFQNSDLTSLSVGVNMFVGSAHNTVSHNLFHDVNMDFTLTPTSVNNNDDAGAQAVLLEGDYNDVGYNTFWGISSCVYDYGGVAGSAITVYGGQHNSIHHNTASGSGANFAEIGANLGNKKPADDNTFAYNLNIGAQFVTIHGPGDYWGPAFHTRLLNNVSYTSTSGSVACGGCAPNVLQMRNNIIWADKSGTLDVDRPFDEANNIFWSRGGSPYNSVPISPTSKIADPMFVDPAGGDFHLRPESPAVNAGTPESIAAGYAVDLDGMTVPSTGPVAIGAYAR